MKIEKIKIDKVSINENNPRFIKDSKFEKLVKSIKEFPEMLQIRPIVVNDDMVVLGGNMRLKACEEAGLNEVYIIKASNLTPEQQEEFIIKDNVSFGEWDFDILANNFDDIKLEEWGINIPTVNENLFDVDDNKKSNSENEPSPTDDNYSTFELIMLHENKLELLDTLNKVKNEFMFEKQEEALMEILRVYNKK